MKTLFCISLALMSTLALAQNCGDQTFLPLDDVDANQVPMDPVSQEPCLVRFIEAKVHGEVVIHGTACDGDADPMIVWREDTGERMAVDPNGVFTFTVTSPVPGIVYTTIGATDGIVTRLATYAVRFRANQAPVLGYLDPEPGNVMHLKQKLLMVWAKWTGMPLSSGFVFQ